MMLTDERLAEIEARYHAAGKPRGDPDYIYGAILASHEDVPALLAEVERLRALGTQMATAIDEMIAWNNMRSFADGLAALHAWSRAYGGEWETPEVAADAWRALDAGQQKAPHA